MVLVGKPSREYPVNAGVPQDSILGPPLFLLYTDDLPDYAMCNTTVYADTSLYFKCDQISWSVATTRTGFWTGILPSRNCGLGQKKPC